MIFNPATDSRNRSEHRAPLSSRLVKGAGPLGMILLVSLMLGACDINAQAQGTDDGKASKLDVQVFPESIELPLGGGKAEAQIIMRNHVAGATIREIRIYPFSNISVKWEIEPKEAQIINPEGELAWTIKLWNENKDPVAGIVYLRIDYISAAQGQPQAVARVATASLNVTTQDIENVADVKVETTLQTLEWQRPGKVYLVITNKSNQTISISDVKAEGPGFIEFDTSAFEKRKGQWLFPPHQTGSIQIDVRAKERVQPGKHLLVFTLPFQWGKDDTGQTRNIVAQKEVSVGVLGEATILALLAVPSFLLLPGILILVAWGLLWNLGFLRSKRDEKKFPLEFSEQPGKLQFWVAAITISIVVIYVYMRIYRDLLGTYGLSDIVLIWLLSVALIGAGGYIVMTLLLRYLKYRRTPQPNDTPAQILKKLRLQGLGVLLERVKVKTKNNEQVFLLQPKIEGETTTWVAPSIIIEWSDKANEERTRAVDDEVRPNGNANVLASLIGKKRKDGTIKNVKWDDSRQIKKPSEVNVTDLEYDASPYYIIERKYPLAKG